MQQTPNLDLPYIMPSQAQKHVTHNEAIGALDAVVQLAVLDRDLAAPPASPAEGDRYIVGGGATGAWAGHDGEITAWRDGAWAFFPPREGWRVWLADEETLLVRDGQAWRPATSLNPAPLVGVNATADAANRLAVAAPASLFNHEGADHRLKINKNAAGDTASVLFQTGFSGRAEMGLAGDDHYSFKVSADGANWLDAILIDGQSGRVTLPNSSNPGFETAYTPDSFMLAASAHVVISGLTLGLDDLGDTGFAAGVWTVGAADAGLWLLAAFAQVNSALRALLTLEASRDGGANWDVVFRVQDDGANEISRTVSLTPMIFLAEGDMIRFTVYQTNGAASENSLRFFTANGRRIQ